MCERGYLKETMKVNNKDTEVVSCMQCNFRSGYYSLDSIPLPTDTRETGQKQICYKSKSRIFWIILIIALLLIVIIIVVVVVRKRKLRKHQENLKGSMLGGY
jgi:subtilase family serine protease